MLHNIWILCSIVLVLLIISNNPKAQNMGTQNKLFGSTRSAEETTVKLTWFFILLFFILTIFLSSYGEVK